MYRKFNASYQVLWFSVKVEKKPGTLKTGKMGDWALDSSSTESLTSLPHDYCSAIRRVQETHAPLFPIAARLMAGCWSRAGRRAPMVTSTMRNCTIRVPGYGRPPVIQSPAAPATPTLASQWN
jgi:hypothetical protein